MQQDTTKPSPEGGHIGERTRIEYMCRNWLDETPDWWAIATNPSLAELVWHTLKAEEAEKIQAMCALDHTLQACRAALALLTNPDAEDRDADSVTDKLRQAILNATH